MGSIDNLSDNTETAKQILDSVPDPATTLKHTQFLESLDLYNVTDTFLEDYILQNLPILNFSNSFITPGTKLYRGRKNKTQTPHSDYKNLFAPETPSKVYGRAHRPGENIFYCAANHGIAAMEVLEKTKEPQFVTIGVWEVVEQIHVAKVIASPEVLSVRPDIKERYEMGQDMIRKNGHVSDQTILSSNILNQFFTKQFTKTKILSPNDYKITALFTNALREMNKFIAPQYKNESIEGIAYPSVAVKYRGDNAAIFIESAKYKLKLIHAYNVVIIDFGKNQENLNMSFLLESESIIDGKIKWKHKMMNYKSPIK